MRPASNSTPSMAVAGGGAGGSRNVCSPIPYLFGGIALVLSLTAVALLILACSYRKSNSSSNSADNEEKQAKTVDSSEPKIVVIMAGESHPTYLAEPVSSISTCHAEQLAV